VNLLSLTLAGLTSISLAVTSSQAADPDFSLKDGQVLGRTLGYVGETTSNVAVVGIAFAPANPASQREAALIQSVIGDELAAGRVRLRVRLLPVEQLAAAAGINAIYVTGGLYSGMSAVATAAQRLHVPTIAANLACVQSGGCIVGFSSEPTVQILVDQQAAEKTGVHFRQAFLMLVREK